MSRQTEGAAGGSCDCDPQRMPAALALSLTQLPTPASRSPLKAMGHGVMVLTLLLAAVSSGLASSDEPLAGLIARAETASVQAQPSLYAEIAERQLQAADQLYNSGKMDAGRAAVSEVITYSDRAHDAASHASSKLKHTEIVFRKMAAKLRDIKRTLPYEEQAPVQDAAEHLERLRTDLLARMFKAGK
jgi:hypothetical protein